MMTGIAAHGGAFVPILVFGTVITVFLVSQIAKARAEQKRVMELRLLARRLGFDNFNPMRDEQFAVGWGFLNRLAQGSDRYAYNILRGSHREEQLFVFDFHFQTGSGKSRQEHNCTLLMIVCREVFPRLTIGPESLGVRITAALGLGDAIKFESAEFSRQFCVRSPDKKFAYDVCNPQMIDYLLKNPGLQMEIQGPALLLTFEPRLPAGKIEFNLQRLAQIRSFLPEYLFSQNA